MQYPLTTGQAAGLLSTTEPRLADLVRKGKISPRPEVVVGRRLWHLEHVLQAADVLGVLDGHLRAHLAGLEVNRAS